MALERHLAPRQVYIPADLVARDERTRVIDLDHDDLSSVQADACALLGVLEYLFDAERVLANVSRRFPRVVVSYNVRYGDDLTGRLEHGWVNHYTLAELTALLRAYFTIEAEEPIDDVQRLFRLRPLSA
jgi:hypothetical protein